MTTSARGPELRVDIRLGVAALIGAAAAALTPLPSDVTWVVRALVGFVVAALVLVVPLLFEILRVDAARTRAYVAGHAPSRSQIDAVIFGAALASLAGVGIMLLAPSAGSHKLLEAGLAVATVVCGWVLIHTLYTLRYARHYYNKEPDCIDFNTDDDPRFTDFAYVAFGLGMTYQVADTDLRSSEVRRIVLFHTLLSYLFGTGIIAVTINLVAGLSQ
ncbi:MAG: DUF1345 domain-containing protein [Micrococcales bacterium]|nr:DUF1345 domain-containing protein [Micrococcales bacterium]